MTILESEVSVKKDVPEEEKEEMKAETNEEIRMEKGEFDDGDNKHISGAFETVTEEDILMEKGKLEDNGATYQSRGNKSQDQSNQTPNSSNLSMGAALLSVSPNRCTPSSEEEDEQQQRSGDAIPRGDIAGGGSHQPLVPEATIVQERPVVLAVRQHQTFRDDEIETTPKRCLRRNVLVGALVALLVIAAVIAAVVVVAIEGDNETLASSKGDYPVLITLAPSRSPSSKPSTSLRPSPSPSNSFKTNLVELIQSRSPETNMSSSHVAAAFDWIASDPYSVSLESDDDRLVQRFALATVWFAYGLESSTRREFQGWMQPTDECYWRGLGLHRTPTCDSDGIVDHLDMFDRDAMGYIPAELMLLSNLMYLRLNGNLVTGTIPSQLSLLPSLTTLELRLAILTGTIPQELWSSLTNLEMLAITSGPEMSPSVIPSGVSSLSNLSFLQLFGVPLAGTIPTEMGSLTALTRLYLMDCLGMTGTIPTSFGLLTQLNRLEVTGSQLMTGPIPTELGLLDSLTTLALGQNSFASTIPTELGKLIHLSWLSLHQSGVTGTIPTEIGQLGMLTYLDVGQNMLLEGTIMTELGLLRQLEELLLGGNDLRGTLPTELGLLTSLENLSLSNNRFSGSVPSEVMSSLTLNNGLLLHLENNDLTGSIPDSVCAMADVVVVVVVECKEIQCSCCICCCCE